MVLGRLLSANIRQGTKRDKLALREGKAIAYIVPLAIHLFQVYAKCSRYRTTLLFVITTLN